MECPFCRAQIAYLGEQHRCMYPELSSGDPPTPEDFPGTDEGSHYMWTTEGLAGLGYGVSEGGTKRVMKTTGVTKEDAQELLDKIYERYPAVKEGWDPKPSKREMLLALRKRSAVYLEANPDPNPPRSKWQLFCDAFSNAFGVPLSEPVTAEQIMERAALRLNRASARATIQVCDEILEELDE